MHHRLTRLQSLRPLGWLGSISAALLGLSTAAHAEGPPLKPGLWEIVAQSRQVDGKAMPDPSAQMASQMKNLPPHMRQQIEARMKAHGVQMTPGQGGMTVRTCVTQDMLDQNRWQRTDGKCQSQMLGHTGNTWNWKVRCTQPPSEGEGSTTVTGGDSYVNLMRMTTQQNGKPHTMTMKHSGKWVSASCGDIKPIQPQQQR